MFSISKMRVGALLAAASLAVVIFAQTPGELMGQAKTAYDQKQYAKSAELYLQAYAKDSKQILALYNAACSFALEGQKDKAFEALEQLAARGYNSPQFIKQDTDFEGLRSDSRWEKIVAKLEENAKKNPPPKPWIRPYKPLATPTDPAPFLSKLGSNKEAVYAEGDVLTFLIKSPEDKVQLIGGIQDPMKEIGTSDVWILQVQLPDLGKAFVSYAFAEGTNFTNLKLKEWRGSEAPKPAVRAEVLQGKVEKRNFQSASLGEERTLFIYIPPNAPASDIPAVFLADGGACEEFARYLEPLILSGQVRPVAIVGIPSGMYKGKPGEPYNPDLDIRAKDYVPGQDEAWFEKHMKFFTEEVGAYVAKEFGISTKRENRAVTGFSNGGAFSASVAVRMPEFFGTSMPLSLGVPDSTAKPTSPMPRMLFAAGTLESFSARTKEFYEKMKSWGVDATYEEYMAGHDPDMWHLAFARMMPRVFPGK